MAVYKVIQDVEAEDKLLGPLSLKQFIYAIVSAVLIYIDFRMLVATELGPIRYAIIFILLLPALLFGLLAAPLGRDQPTEVWVLAHIRFFLKPRKRIWNQSGLSHLVTITVPKKIEKYFAKDLTQTEVKSRLQALASTLDSRGWAVKNVNVNLYAQPSYMQGGGLGDSDRLISASSLPQAVPTTDIRPEDDMLDERSNATAHHFRDLVTEASAKKKQEMVDKVNSLRQDQDSAQQQSGTPSHHSRHDTDTKPDYWFMNESQAVPAAARDDKHAVFTKPATVTPMDDEEGRPAALKAATNLSGAEERELLSRIHKEDTEIHKHHPHLKPAMSRTEEQQAREAANRAAQTAPHTQQPAMTAQQQAAILDLAYNKDFSVATTAQQAKRIVDQGNPDEVVISLH